MSNAPRVNIGTSDLEVFPLNLGANTFGWTADEAASFDILDHYVEAGGNFIDTADVYSAWAPGNNGGDSEIVLGKWLRSRKTDDAIVATKGGKLPPFDSVSPKDLQGAVEASLKRLQRDVIDLYYLHFDDEKTPIDEQIEGVTTLVESGKIRHAGISNYTPQRMAEFLEKSAGTPAAPVAMQPEYNLLQRKNFEQGFAPLAQKYGLGVFSYFSLASGMLTGKYREGADIEGTSRERFLKGLLSEEEAEKAVFTVVGVLSDIADAHDVEPASVALAWLRAKGVTAPIASASQLYQLNSLIQGAALDLSAEDVSSLDEVSKSFS